MTLSKNDGEPLSDPSEVTQWLKTKTGSLFKKESVSVATQCSFCWRSGTQGTGHATAKCPTLSSWNKIRSNTGLTPIRIVLGSIMAGAEKEPVSVEKVAKDVMKEIRDVKALLSGMEKRLMVVEKKSGVKRSAPDSPSTGSSESKRQKKEKKKDGKDGGSSDPSSSKRDKGKGKEKSK